MKAAGRAADGERARAGECGDCLRCRHSTAVAPGRGVHEEKWSGSRRVMSKRVLWVCSVVRGV